LLRLAAQYGIPSHQVSLFTQRLEHALKNAEKWPRLEEVMRSDGFSELPFSLNIGQGRIEGVIDRVYRYENEWIVVDYKTDEKEPEQDLRRWLRERTEHHSLQMDIYALATSRWIAPGQQKIRVILFFASQGKEVILEYTMADLKAIRSKVRGLIDGIADLICRFNFTC
jgi:ATP-dependent exoDNAse (exonuclease V) beta subunit